MRQARSELSKIKEDIAVMESASRKLAESVRVLESRATGFVCVVQHCSLKFVDCESHIRNVLLSEVVNVPSAVAEAEKAHKKYQECVCLSLPLFLTFLQ